MTRRAFLSAATAAAAPQDRRPNVLFLSVDDMNDWAGVFGGHPQSRTPNIDRLAARGVRFERAYCQAPMCNPSRASLFTGLRPTTTGIYDNDQAWRAGARDVVTLPEYFMKHGYQVAGCGKNFHASQTDYSCFHEYFKTPPFLLPPGGKKKSKGETGKIQWGVYAGDEEDEADTRVAQWAAAFLKREHARPFFLGAGFIRPHLPWFASRRHFDLFPPDKTILPEYLEHDLDDVPRSAIRQQAVATHAGLVKSGKWREAVAAYLACIHYADSCVGRVLDALAASPHASDTVVVLLGDHGWHLGEKQHWQKFTLWERSCRAPLLIAAPGVSKPGGACRRPVEFLDLYPTLTDLCGLPSVRANEGISLRRLLADPAAPWDRPAITSNGSGKITVRTARWRYTRYPDGEELYDHSADPNEWTNLAGHPESAPVMRELAAHFPRNPSRAPLPVFDDLEDAEKARLRGKVRG